MALYLVGEHIDKMRSHYRVETGKLIPLMRGIYVESNDDIETVVLKHAVRIAKYLYPRAYLSAASAVLLGPTIDGKLFISGPRIQRTRIRNLEIIQNKFPQLPSISAAIIDDGMGEFKVDVSSIRQRFLESFRRQSEHSASIDHTMRSTIAERLIEEYSSIDKTADALWVIARQNEWFHEGEKAERYLKKGLERTEVKNQANFTLIVAWHGNPIGKLSHDGFEWRWTPEKDNLLALVRQTVPGKLPPFISALLPEGWLENILQENDERTALRSGKRYMSNITIVEDRNELPDLPPDILETTLAQYSDDGVFTGTYAGPSRDSIENSFERNLAKIYNDAETPRLSGVQIKAPMYLDKKGILSPSLMLPFTHILKPAGTNGFEFLPIIEWLSFDLARRIGLKAPDFVLMNMPDKMLPSLVVERFDIRRSVDDDRLLALEDFCSLLDISSADKYKGTIEQAARALKTISSSPNEDLLILLKRVLFAWLIADGDMHLKNMAVLKMASKGENKFYSVRMSPVYDAVCTVVFPNLKHDRMALKMNGKDSRLKRADFMKLASIMGIKTIDAENLINETLSVLAMSVDQAQLPLLIDYDSASEKIAVEMLEECRARIKRFRE